MHLVVAYLFLCGRSDDGCGSLYRIDQLVQELVNEREARQDIRLKNALSFRSERVGRIAGEMLGLPKGHAYSRKLKHYASGDFKSFRRKHIICREEQHVVC